MHRRADKIASWLAALLVAASLCIAASAQSTGMTMGGAISGSGLGGGGGAGVGGARGFHPGSGFGAHGGGRFRGGRRSHGEFGRGGDLIVAPFWYPGWYDDWDGGYDEPYYNAPPQPPPVPVPMVVMPPPPPQPERIPSNPKVVELPSANKAAPHKLPPALFILNNGERLESEHYLLTADQLQITSDRQLRVIPLSAIDLEATLAANRKRGLDLQVPSGGGEISVGF